MVADWSEQVGKGNQLGHGSWLVWASGSW